LWRYIYRQSGRVGWAHTTSSSRLCSIPGPVKPKTFVPVPAVLLLTAAFSTKAWRWAPLTRLWPEYSERSAQASITKSNMILSFKGDPSSLSVNIQPAITFIDAEKEADEAVDLLVKEGVELPKAGQSTIRYAITENVKLHEEDKNSSHDILSWTFCMINSYILENRMTVYPGYELKWYLTLLAPQLRRKVDFSDIACERHGSISVFPAIPVSAWLWIIRCCLCDYWVLEKHNGINFKLCKAGMHPDGTAFKHQSLWSS